MIARSIDYLRFVKSKHPHTYRLSIGLLLLFVLMAIASFIDPRHVHGVSTWHKPMKFALSIAIYLITMVGLVYYLNISERSKRRIIRLIYWVLLIEYVLLFIQAARGVPSHFNHSTPFNLIVFNTMGLLIAINTFALLYVAILYFAPKSRPNKMNTNTIWLIRMGLLLILFSSAIGARMVGFNHHLAQSEAVLFVVPFMGWKVGSGDLRISHFLGMHGLQLFPLMPIILAMLWKNAKQVLLERLSLIIAALYSGLVVGLFLLALGLISP
jgi:hypothetical protein